MESKDDWVDFKKLKSEVGFAEVLESFNLLGGMELIFRSVVQLSCPGAFMGSDLLSLFYHTAVF
jgi:hypothetical protein